jgi:hypothetical protein
MIWTKVHIVTSAPQPLNQFYAVPTANRGLAVKRVLRDVAPNWLENLDSITTTAETGPLEPDEGLPLLRL